MSEHQISVITSLFGQLKPQTMLVGKTADLDRIRASVGSTVEQWQFINIDQDGISGLKRAIGALPDTPTVIALNCAEGVIQSLLAVLPPFSTLHLCSEKDLVLHNVDLYSTIHQKNLILTLH